MVDLECPSRRWSARLVVLINIGFSACLAQPVAITPRWHADFPAVVNGNPCESTAVPLSDESTMVVVVAAGADVTKPKLQLGTRTVPVRMMGHDTVSRLGFIQAEGGMTPKAMSWAEDAIPSANATLHVVEAGRSAKCRTMGWVKQVGGKILPFALLRVNFSEAIPPPGTPLLDSSGRVVAIIFQSAGSGNSAYAIPAEAVHRVHRDIITSGRLVRGWLGLALRSESQIPQISSVLPNSPAATAGIKPNDVLLSIGSRPISEYADAANAFFYLIPGQPVSVKLLRGVEPLEFTLTPTKPQA